MGNKLEKRIAKISDQMEDQTKELNRLKRDFKHYQTGQLINAEYTHELESKLLLIKLVKVQFRPKGLENSY